MAGVALAAAAVLFFSFRLADPQPPAPLLLAPMLHGTDLCTVPDGSTPPPTQKALATYCVEHGRSAADLAQAGLAQLGPPRSRNGRFEIGYTLQIPLLKLFIADGSDWKINQRAVDRLALTVNEIERPVVLYLFSTHFGVNAPIEEALARDPSNLAVSNQGPMPKDTYEGIDIYPWTFASTETAITRYRQMAIRAVVDAICRLPAESRQRIRGVSLLGELHHFHADFEHGMQVGGPYVISDYSAASVAGFRDFLSRRFGNIEALNRELGESFRSFADVDPPGKDIRRERLRRFTEHIDSFAHGRLPVAGWAFDPARGPTGFTWIRVYLDGAPAARVPARFGRQDVVQRRPEIGTADVGWRYDLDFSKLAPGIHHIDVLAERADGGLVKVGRRDVSIMDRTQSTPEPVPSAPLPETQPAAGLEAHIDEPPALASFFYNPLVPLWHEFRGRQVVEYLRLFERQVRASCLGGVDLYTHQITPFTNPGWDATKFAADASLTDPGTLVLGVSLYGEATYGTSFPDWLATTKHRRYGVTEFHPLRAMTEDEVRRMFEQHRERGAQFISFFLDVRPRQGRIEAERNRFAIDPSNPDFGSDRLYRSIRAVISD